MEKSENDKRIMTVQVLWGAMLMSCVMFGAATFLIVPHAVAPNPLRTIAPILGLVGLAAGLFVGHVLKAATFEKAMGRFILACVLCETASIGGF